MASLRPSGQVPVYPPHQAISHQPTPPSSPKAEPPRDQRALDSALNTECCEWGNDKTVKKTVKELIAKKADVNNRLNPYGKSPLSFAGARGHIPLMKELIDARADVNAQDNLGSTVLHWANNIDQVMLLLNAGADPDIRDNENLTPADRSIVYPYLEKMLSDKPVEDGFSLDEVTTAELQAARGGYVHVLERLIDKNLAENSTIERNDKRWGSATNVVHQAAAQHNVAVLTCLLAQGRFDADPLEKALEHRDSTGKTPLEYLLDPKGWNGENGERVATCIALLLVAGAEIPKNLSEAQNEMLKQARQRVDELKEATKEQLLEAGGLPDALAQLILAMLFPKDR